MSKILAFSGSNSSTSINQSLIRYVSGLAGAEVVNLRDYNFPMFGEDLEKSDGIPADITTLQNKILAVDAVIISTPEHNGHLPAFFKNILDWLSRTGVKYLEGKLVLVLSTSNGGGGAAKAAAALDRPVRYAGGELFATLSLPNYRDNFDREAEVVINEEWNQIIKSTLNEMDIRLNA
ncbi:MAG: NADPH-dependent FMN reductase [Crocinitomicaceae bacterium]